MRFSTVLSLFIALILAVLAVWGAQNWLNLERQQFAAALRQQLQQEEVEKEPENTIVVANKAISFGERIDQYAVREIPWPSDVLPEGGFAKIEDLVVGDTEDDARFALTSMTVGEPILSSKVTVPGQRAKLSTALPDGMKAISIRVNDVLGVAGFVLPGDRVDVLLTRGGRGDKSFVDVLLQGVKVLAIDQIADDRKDQPSVVRTVTFEVNTQEAQKLVLAGNVGTLSLALRNFASTEIEPIDRITLDDLSDFDVAENLPTAELGEPQSDPSLERIAELEALLKSLSEGVSEKIDGVEKKLSAQEPVIKEVVKEVIVEVERQPIVPVKRTVGVIRNGQRNEYKVDEGGKDDAENVAEDEEADVSNGGATLRSVQNDTEQADG